MKKNIKKIIGILIMIGFFLLWFMPRVMSYANGIANAIEIVEKGGIE